MYYHFVYAKFVTSCMNEISCVLMNVIYFSIILGLQIQIQDYKCRFPELPHRSFSGQSHAEGHKHRR